MDAIRLGPLAFPLQLLILLGAFFTALAAVRWPRPRTAIDYEGAIWWIALTGVVAARLAFVIQYWPAYASQPWTALDIRDGGFNAWAGGLVVLLTTLFRVWRESLLHPRLPVAVFCGMLFWGVGSSWGLHTSSKPSLPTLPFQTLDGQITTLQQFVGRPVVVNLWASWCPPCHREMPVFQEAQARYPEVAIVLVNQGESRATVTGYLLQHDLTLEYVWLDPSSTLSATSESVGLPTTLFFSSEGELQSRRMGELSAATLEHRIRQLQAMTP